MPFPYHLLPQKTIIFFYLGTLIFFFTSPFILLSTTTSSYHLFSSNLLTTSQQPPSPPHLHHHNTSGHPTISFSFHSTAIQSPHLHRNSSGHSNKLQKLRKKWEKKWKGAEQVCFSKHKDISKLKNN